MRVSYRQAKRLWKRYQAGGVANLKHGNAGRMSNRAQPIKQRQKILRKVEEKYAGFGPPLAAEHLAMEDRLRVHPETLRRWMLAEGLWKKASQREAALKKAGTPGALWGVGADGRQLREERRVGGCHLVAMEGMPAVEHDLASGIERVRI